MSDATTVLLELCQRATNLANINSTRTVEYLTASKSHQTHGFRGLAINFLEVCQTLWPIQAGLLEAARAEDQLPIDVAKELTDKVSSTIDNFNFLDLLLSKLLIYERKKGFSKLTKGFGMMGIDTEVHRLSAALAKDRDSLRMGSLAFKWILGDANLPSSTGSAYTSLATALKAANGQKPPSASSSSTRASNRQPSNKSATSTDRTVPTNVIVPNLDQLPPLPAWEGSLLGGPTLPTKPTGLTTPSSAAFPNRSRQSDLHTPESKVSAQRCVTSTELKRGLTTPAIQELHHSSDESRRGTISDTSMTTVESMIQFEDMLKNYDYERRSPSQPRALSKTASPPTVRRTQRPPPATPTTVKAALIAAVQAGNHEALEELLEQQIPAEIFAELRLLNNSVLHEDFGSLRLLLVHGADPNYSDGGVLSPLSTATEMSSYEAASILVRYGANPNLSATAEGESPLLMAISGDKIDLLELYLKHGCGVNEMLPDGDTPFLKSINKTTSADVVSLLLESGAEPDKKSTHGETPLVKSLFAKRVDLATLLLDHKANPNLAGPKHPLWPSTYDPALLSLMLSRGAKPRMAPGIMELATSLNCIESVKILLQYKIDPNIKKDGVYTPLCSAIRDDRSEIVTLLLKNGADPNVPASEYPAFKCVSHNRLHFLPQIVAAGADIHTPKGILEVAVAHNNKEALMNLLDAGVDVNAKNSQADGATALSTAIRDNNLQFVDILLAHGANPAIRGSDWPLVMSIRSPTIMTKILPCLPKNYHSKGIIEQAVVADQLDSVKLLAAAGFSVEDKTGGVFSPMTTALRERHIDIVHFLLDEAGADINAPGEHLPIVKALRRCCGPEDTEAIEILLERGADINLVYRGWNGVMQAIERGDAEILRLLVQKSKSDVDLNAKDDEGQTVLEFARERGWDEGEAILLGKEF
ncbi:hypothetical protein LTR64_005201 [Lithohypha guttulata]|uniref:uncharacterized protein n=1 Tax=Lithohypha guttulata TaxID=1690604 RepID=UPI00315D00CB